MVASRTSREVILDTCCRMEGRVVGVRVRVIGDGLYAKSKPHYTYLLDEESFAPHWTAIETITFATKLTGPSTGTAQV
ncbi:hypothetical protein MYCTH_2307497 [Thermothelomyces thermophilus ATCC 42464]|uniref:Uncharacterized protein n=1 Tax=Thermothelomyces thermophilus (strain ATCC 42464 / BCRC 31852 / DSM 1799) TaxID=573729 RepID=G2QFZ1_THET4|nr:uncharacterized protein MYCTH_2307497 [Thermothelomyces thermophilus ATCC 42464]AEO59304.1 hypothetical protein MYCTH_2307497 [Thermothelomyces thermophilus ATCC 42464]